MLGSAMLALSPAGFTLSPEATNIQDRELVHLGLELEWKKRRVRDLHWQMQRHITDHAWQQWSDACANLAQLCERIAKHPATTIEGIAIRYEALSVGLLDDDVIMDEVIRRQAAALRRSLARMVHIGPQL